MSKLTVIQLLNKIAKGEEVPKKIKYNNEIFEYYKDLKNYIRPGKPNTLFTMYYIHKILNDEIEIIEEKPKKIEECKSYEDFEGIDDYIEHLRDKINKLTKSVNYLLEKESDK